MARIWQETADWPSPAMPASHWSNRKQLIVPARPCQPLIGQTCFKHVSNMFQTCFTFNYAGSIVSGEVVISLHIWWNTKCICLVTVTPYRLASSQPWHLSLRLRCHVWGEVSRLQCRITAWYKRACHYYYHHHHCNGQCYCLLLSSSLLLLWSLSCHNHHYCQGYCPITITVKVLY